LILYPCILAEFQTKANFFIANPPCTYKNRQELASMLLKI